MLVYVPLARVSACYVACAAAKAHHNNGDSSGYDTNEYEKSGLLLRGLGHLTCEIRPDKNTKNQGWANKN